MQLRALSLALALLLGSSTLIAQSLPDAPTATRRVESGIAQVQDSVHNRVTFENEVARVEQMLADYQSRLSMEQVDRYRTQLTEYRSEYQRFAEDEDFARLGTAVDALEQQWDATRAALKATDSPASEEGAVDDLRRAIVDLRAEQAKLPAARVRALSNRIDAVAQSFESLVGASANAAALASAEEYWQRDTADSAGWEQERAVDFDTYSSTRSQLTAALGLPKTLEIWQQANQKLAQAKDGSDVPAAFVSKIEDVRKRSRARLLQAAAALVAAGVARDAGDSRAREALGLLDESLRVTLDAANDLEFAALSAQTGAWLKAAADGDTQSEEGRARYYQRMTVSAAAAWPEMEKQFAVVRGFDPGNPDVLKGQLIRIETDNLMGWRFKTGDFPFATTISGMPVAATFDADVEAAIAEIESKLGRALGDSDDDGRWTIIAEVTGRMGRMQLRKQIEGDIRDSSSGEKLGTYSGEAAESVDAPILRIVAAHVGPLAVARGTGVASADGSLQSGADANAAGAGAGANTGSGVASGGLLARIPALMLSLLAAALCFAQARPTAARALAERQGQGVLFDRSRPLFPWLGLGFALVGLWWLLRGLIIGDLLPALALIAAGTYSALPLIHGRGLLPAAQLERVQPFGLALAIATVVLASAHLLLGGQVLV